MSLRSKLQFMGLLAALGKDLFNSMGGEARDRHQKKRKIGTKRKGRRHYNRGTIQSSHVASRRYSRLTGRDGHR